jgi:hypothetical protein
VVKRPHAATRTPAFLDRLRAKLPEGRLRAAAPPLSRGTARALGGARPPPSSHPARPRRSLRSVRAAAEARRGHRALRRGHRSCRRAGFARTAGAAHPVARTDDRHPRPLARGERPVAEAGAVIADIQSAAEAADRLFPLSYGSEGTARIGGALAVNSGGVNVLRYGNARPLPRDRGGAARRAHPPRPARLRKDNTGYDLRNLLIGSEGTLGVITAASLRLFPRPARTGTALFSVRDPPPPCRSLHAPRPGGRRASPPSNFSGIGLALLDEADMGLRQPFDPIPAWVALVDLGLPPALDPDAELEALFAAAHAAGEVTDGSSRKAGAARRLLAPARGRARGQSQDRRRRLARHLAAAVGDPQFLPRRAVGRGRHRPLRVNAFGHLGDGNLHYNVFRRREPPPSDFIADPRDKDLSTARSMTSSTRWRAPSALNTVSDASRPPILNATGTPRGSTLCAVDQGPSRSHQGIMNPGAVLRPRAR